jgi:hypothetical protein
MNKGLFPFFFMPLFLGMVLTTQAQLPQPHFFVGSGSDTTLFVVDFKDGSFDSSYVWGYLYSGSQTGEDLLNAIADADVNLDVNIDTASFGNFLQDITYILHDGIGGAPDYWSTWEGSDLATLTSNSGIASPLISGGVFGVSYTDFNPAVAPGVGLPAYDPSALNASMINKWIGSGNDSLIMIIDFSDSSDTSSFAWGYLFNDSVSYLDVLSDLDQQDSALSISISGAVTNINYKGLSGMIGALSDWYVWEAENFGNWRLRYVDEVYLHPGDLGAVVYTRFLNPVRPNLPSNLDQGIEIREIDIPKIEVFPNPTQAYLRIDGSALSYTLYSLNGHVLLEGDSPQISLNAIQSGTYILEIEVAHQEFQYVKVIKTGN